MSYWSKVERSPDGRWLVPSEPGVYVIGTDHGLYIGQGTKMWRRFVGNHFKWMKDGVHLVLWIKVKRSRKYADWLTDEKRLIKKLKPALNQGGYVGAKRRGMVGIKRSLSAYRPEPPPRVLSVTKRKVDPVGKIFHTAPKDDRAYTRTKLGWVLDVQAEELLARVKEDNEKSK